MTVNPRLAMAATAAAVLALAAWSAWHRWVFLSSSPYPMGIDGYFYAIQLRSIVEHGELHYPASPLAFWLMAPLAAITDPVTGAKLGAAILGALIAVPAYFVGKRLGGSRAPGLLAAALATTSAGSFYLSIEFVKNGIGLTVALTYLWMLLRALEEPRRGRIVVAVVALIAAMLTHKMAAGLAIVATVPALAIEARARGVIGPWRVIASPWRLAVLVVVAIKLTFVAMAVLARVFPGRFPGLRELALLDDVLDPEARWALPALDLTRKQLWFGHEALIGGLAGLGLLIALLVRRLIRAPASTVRPSATAMAIALAVVSLAIALPWLDVGDPQGLGFRLRIAAFAPMALVAAALVGAIPAPVSTQLRSAAVIAFAAVWALAQPDTRDEGVIRTHPAMATAVMGLDGAVPADAVVICPERHILFMAAWYADREVRLRPEEVPEDRRWRLMPLAFIGRDSPLDHALVAARRQPELVPPRGLHPRLPNGLVVVPEATWRWVVEQLPDRLRQRMRTWPTI